MNINRNYIGTINRTAAGNTGRIKYIVIHYFGTLASATNLGKYWKSSYAGASAHYGVDHNGDVYQYVEDGDIAWHCGANKYVHPDCRNANSIGIEMAVRKRSTATMNATDHDWYFEEATVQSAIELTRELMRKYNIPASHVIRHYDVTGKICPNPFVYNEGSRTWAYFKNEIANIQNGGSVITSPAPDASTTAGYLWNEFRKAGYPDVAIAGMIGNLDKESALLANNLQNSYERTIGMSDEGYTAAVDAGIYTKDQFINDKAGYGLAQWTFWSRKKALYEFVKEDQGLSIGNMVGQTAFLLYELNKDFSGLVARLKAATSVREASDLILTEFEKPADMSETVKQNRAAAAQKYFDTFSKGSPVSDKGTPFSVKVTATDLRIRKGPGTNHAKWPGYTGKGVFTIVDTADGLGSSSGWGKLKYYADRNLEGWIALDFAKRI